MSEAEATYTHVRIGVQPHDYNTAILLGVVATSPDSRVTLNVVLNSEQVEELISTLQGILPNPTRVK